MILFILLLILLFPSLVCSAPSTTVSITPAAVDATTITASDENTRNSAVSTWANAHDHNDIDQTANTVAVGDATAGNKTIQANNADVSKPFIRYDDTNNRWVSSRDGTIVESFVVLTGATNGAFIYTPTKLRDADENTLIQVEESANENVVRIDTNGTERWIMTAAGERTMPTQPAFLVITSADQDNIAVNSQVTVVFGTEIFDQSNDFATNTFTAPVTGKYQLNANITFINMDTLAVDYQIQIITSNRTYTITKDPRQFAADVAGRFGDSISVLADMDISDTAIVQVFQTSGTQQTDIQGTTEVMFNGYLAL